MHFCLDTTLMGSIFSLIKLSYIGNCLIMNHLIKKFQCTYQTNWHLPLQILVHTNDISLLARQTDLGLGSAGQGLSQNHTWSYLSGRECGSNSKHHQAGKTNRDMQHSFEKKSSRMDTLLGGDNYVKIITFLLKRVFSKGKATAPHGSKFYPFRVEPYSKGK